MTMIAVNLPVKLPTSVNHLQEIHMKILMVQLHFKHSGQKKVKDFLFMWTTRLKSGSLLTFNSELLRTEKIFS